MFTNDGEPWSEDGPRRAFLDAAWDASGMKERGRLWHVLRHTYASILAGGDIRRDVVMELMGHKRQGSTTDLYTHLFKDAYEGVEEVLAAALCVPDASLDDAVATNTHSHPLGLEMPDNPLTNWIHGEATPTDTSG